MPDRFPQTITVTAENYQEFKEELCEGITKFVAVAFLFGTVAGFFIGFLVAWFTNA